MSKFLIYSDESNLKKCYKEIFRNSLKIDHFKALSFQINFSNTDSKQTTNTIRNLLDMAVPKIIFSNLEFNNNSLTYFLKGCQYGITTEIYRIISEQRFRNFSFTNRLRDTLNSKNLISTNSKDSLIHIFNNQVCNSDNKEINRISNVVDLNSNLNENTIESKEIKIDSSLLFLEYIQSEILKLMNDSNLLIVKSWVDTQRKNPNSFLISDELDRFELWLNNTYFNNFSHIYVPPDSYDNENTIINDRPFFYFSQIVTDITKNLTAKNNITQGNSTSIMNKKPKLEDLKFSNRTYRQYFANTHTHFTNIRMIPNFSYEYTDYRIVGDDFVISKPFLMNRNGSFVIDNIDSFLFKPSDLNFLFTIDENFRFKRDDDEKKYHFYSYFNLIPDHSDFITSEWKYNVQLKIAIYDNRTESGNDPSIRLYVNNGKFIDPPKLDKIKFIPGRLNILSDISSNFTALENHFGFSEVHKNLCKIYDVEKLRIGTMIRYISCQIYNSPVSYNYVKSKLISSHILINFEEDDNEIRLMGVIALDNPVAKGKLITSDSYCLSSFRKYLSFYDVNTNKFNSKQDYQLIDSKLDYYIDINKLTSFYWTFRFIPFDIKAGVIDYVQIYLPLKKEYITFTGKEIFDYERKIVYLPDPSIGGKVMYVTIFFNDKYEFKNAKMNFNCVVIESFYYSHKSIIEFYSSKLDFYKKSNNGLKIGLGIAFGLVGLGMLILFSVWAYRRCYKNSVVTLVTEKKQYSELQNSSMVIQRSNNLSIVDPNKVTIELK